MSAAVGASQRRRRRVGAQELIALQEQQEKIRNICVLAHVDHGKTSLSDCLISSNGIISPRLVGTIRYLDSREDEQVRGITMESSAISLLYEHAPIVLNPSNSCKEPQDYLINLIDSPGHVDFSSDVSTAVRLCDGALIVVDVIEGVCIQTHAVLRQAWEEKLRPCLVLNKIDRLILELKLDSVEAYDHLVRIIEQVNAVMSSFINADNFNKDLDENAENGEDHVVTMDDTLENEYFFYPENGNVAFSRWVDAIDGWAFRLNDFLPFLYSRIETSLPPKKLLSAMWGDFYWNVKEKKLEKIRQIRASESKGSLRGQKQVRIFSKYVFQSIIDVYSCAVIDPKVKRLRKIVKVLELEDLIDQRELRKGGRNALKTIMSSWLSLSKAILAMVVRCVPNPVIAQTKRIDALLPPDENFGKIEDESEFYNAVKQCDSSAQAPVVVFVSKMFAVPRSRLPIVVVDYFDQSDLKETKESANQNVDDEECFVAFARVFAGRAKRGEAVSVLGPKYQGKHRSKEHRKFANLGFYPMMLMGTELIPLESVPAGNICALAGLSQHILKTATITSSKGGVSLSKMPAQSAPVVKVSVQPQDPANWPAVVKGLKLLNRADPVVDVRLYPSGEYVLGAIGELHLERCIKDLKERFAKVDVLVSEPIAVFRETLVLNKIVADPLHLEDEGHLNSSDLITTSTRDEFVSLQFRVLPLPENIIRVIEKFEDLLKSLTEISRNAEDEMTENTVEHVMFEGGDTVAAKIDLPQHGSEGISQSKLKGFQKELATAMKNSDPSWEKLFERIVAFGPHGSGPNVLINNLGEACTEFHEAVFRSGIFYSSSDNGTTSRVSTVATEISNGIVSGFQLASRAGPLCEEPMWGLAILLESISIKNIEEDALVENLKLGPLSGQIMSICRDGIRRAFNIHKEVDDTSCSVRLAEGMYFCQIQCHVDLHQGETLGKLYGVISKRRGKVIKEDMWEGTSIFTIDAYIPVVEAFGLADDLRKVMHNPVYLCSDLQQTSGAASTPQLVFSHFQLLDIDPFFKATREEDLEEHGNLSEDSHLVQNIARRYIDKVRKRKGLATQQKIVVYAEKQRTLTKMK